MAIETVAVTGGNGWIGGRIIEHLNERGYETVDLARGKRREEHSDRYVQTDLLDPGNVYGSLVKADADALIHMGTLPGPGSNPGYEVYESNAMSTYYLLEACEGLDIDRTAIASSINVMGSVYQEEPMEVFYLPVDEEHPVTPRDPYAMGKHALEIACDGFARRPAGPDSIASLRYPWVAGTDSLRDRFGDNDRAIGSDDVGRPPGHRDELFTYVHIDDAVTIARRAIETDLEGHEPFWAVAADTSLAGETTDAIEPYYPDAEVRDEFTGHESFVDISKAEELLGWVPQYSWRDL